MAASLGAHEVMEVHEMLSCAINGINEFQLLRQYVRDPQLRGILETQLQFMSQEYNNMIQMLHGQGMRQAVPYRTPKNIAPVYGLDNPGTQTPNMPNETIDDRDVSSAMLGYHKSSATDKMRAALECADPNIRRMMQQSAINCAEQAFEIWQYMNHSGYYQIPTMKEITTNTVLNMYQQGSMPMNPGTVFHGDNMPQ